MVKSTALTGIASFQATNATSGIDLGHLPPGGIHLVVTPTVPEGGAATGIQYKYTGTRRATSNGGISYSQLPVTLQPTWGTNDSYDWHPLDPGSYTLTVTAADPSFNTSFSKSLTFTIQSADIIGLAGLTASPASGSRLDQVAGGITLTAQTTMATGGGLDHNWYRFTGVLKQWNPTTGSYDSVPVPLDTAFHHGNTFLWAPTTPGTYTLMVTAYDGSYSTTYSKTLTYTLYAASLAGIASVVATPASNTKTLAQAQATGVHFVVTVKPPGGGAGVQYAYQLTRPGSTADPVSALTSENDYDLTAVSLTASGTYKLTVTAYDATHNTSFTSTTTYVVKP